jgi:hypothetical protein
MGKQKSKPLYPLGRCNNCLWYYHTDEIKECPNCKTDAYLMDIPELFLASEMFETLKDTLETLQRIDCQFWACPGPDKPFVDMQTCIRCSVIQEIKEVIAKVEEK